MNYDAHVSAVRREVSDLVTAFAAGPMDAPVPTCPEWTAQDLAQHVGDFSGFWAHVICEGTGRAKPEFPAMPGDAGVAEWIGEIGTTLCDQLGATSPDQPMWSWVPGRENAAFAARRAANELAVHRYDAQTCRGSAKPIDTSLAVDGIEEIFVMVEAWRARDDRTGTGNGETLCLQATDADAAWVLCLTPDGTEVTRSAGDADLTISGKASDLELLLYQRPTIGAVTQDGDTSSLVAWYAAFHFG
ncbi:MAG TPA: maleylpyruvate isomerase N-terminal domain-containing protein [Acidimicrobiales bacterium]|nr:maleylpyruvate isomerase N-terminal domain-containing protein [Acidimicrobiales bacterium]